MVLTIWFGFRKIIGHLIVGVFANKLIVISANKKYIFIEGYESWIYPEFHAIPLLCRQLVPDLFFQPSTHFYRKRIIKISRDLCIFKLYTIKLHTVKVKFTLLYFFEGNLEHGLQYLLFQAHLLGAKGFWQHQVLHFPYNLNMKLKQ